jgi:hypothetical protein
MADSSENGRKNATLQTFRHIFHNSGDLERAPEAPDMHGDMLCTVSEIDATENWKGGSQEAKQQAYRG